MFIPASDSAYTEIEARRTAKGNLLRFGIKFLDDAFRGIFPDDMILLGAQSGVGKTQLVSLIAKANLELGKRVHMIPLESSEFEIERRIKFPYIMHLFFSDPNRPNIPNFNYVDWVLGEYLSEMEPYESGAAKVFERDFKNLFLHHKGERFGVHEMIESICHCNKDTDLIIIDHAHYFDYDGDNENKSLKEIAKTVRMLSIEMKKPIILVAHMRKKDRGNDDIAPGMEEFHGSSDLFKIATKVITVAPGSPTETGKYETFFRLPKHRLDGTASRFLGRCLFDPKTGGYADDYKVGWADASRKNGFGELSENLLPGWAKNESRRNGNGHDSFATKK